MRARTLDPTRWSRTHLAARGVACASFASIRTRRSHPSPSSRYGGLVASSSTPRNHAYFDIAASRSLVNCLTRGGGFTVRVDQVSWGHCCRKPTWLYVVGVPISEVVAGIRVGGTVTHRVTSGPRGPVLPTATKLKRRLTPPDFAAWLVKLARTAGEQRRAA